MIENRIDIYGDNRFPEHTKIREACRGIVVRDGMILLTYEVNTDQWFIPGGGLEDGESNQLCCIRELAEETGYVVNPQRHFVTINEYYEEWLFISHYFTCEITGETQRLLTEREAEVGLEPRWIPLQEAITIFSKHQEYAHDEMKRGAYLREYKALSVYIYEIVKERLNSKGTPGQQEDRDDLETKDLILRQGSVDDWQDLYRNLWSREEVFRYMFNKPSSDEEAGRKRTALYTEMHKEVKTEFLVCEKASGQAIGIAGIKEMKPGFWTITDIAIGPDFHCKGYGKQIVTALLDLAFELGATEVAYNCFTQNTASKQLALSCGFTYAHSEKAELMKNGKKVILDYFIHQGK